MNARQRDALYERIAREFLGFETLVGRKSDQLDLREIAVWNARAALEAAFQAGVAHGIEAYERRMRQER